jgi:hypothetical protein
MPATTSNDLLGTLIHEWQTPLQEWALNGSLAAAAQEALLLNGTPPALEDLITQWGSGDFRSLPPIALLPSADISGAMGAYAISTGTIYLNADWLAGATKDQLFAVLTEELGHHLDGLLNTVDTPGDEGGYFSFQLFHGKPDPVEAQTLRTEADGIAIGQHYLRRSGSIPAFYRIKNKSIHRRHQYPGHSTSIQWQYCCFMVVFGPRW